MNVSVSTAMYTVTYALSLLNILSDVSLQFSYDAERNCTVPYIIGYVNGSDIYPGTGRVWSATCLSGVIFPHIAYVGIVKCLCNGCSNHWRKNVTCSVPRRYLIACRFGGPRWDENCWNNSEDQEKYWTERENVAAAVVSVDHAIVVMDALNMCYHIFSYDKVILSCMKWPTEYHITSSVGTFKTVFRRFRRILRRL